MIDIHTHILPHIDDGAKDTETSIAMLNAEAAQGADTVVLTSHYYGKKYSPARFIERRNGAFERIRSQIPQGLNVRLGAEVHFTGFNVPEYEELCKLAIEGTEYILVELPFMEKWSGGLFNALSDFINETGYTPVIAHVERYREVLKNPAIVSELIRMGCLIQVNAQAFSEKRERNFVFALMKHNMVHCIGSDAHDMQRRSPDMTSAKETVTKAGYAAEWDNAQEIMRRILANKEVRVEAGAPVKKIFGFYR